jgi:hypothetical protein
MISRVITSALLLMSAACASFAGLSVSALIDQPWNEVREPILSDATNVAIWSTLAALSISAAAAFLALFVRRLRVRSHGLLVLA